jgi:hypothetical protein
VEGAFLFTPELIEQAAFAALGSVSLPGFQQSLLSQVSLFSHCRSFLKVKKAHGVSFSMCL